MTNPLLQTLAAAIHTAYNAPKKDQPELLRAAADLMIELRSQINTADGEPDWRGSTYEYRMAIGEALGGAGVPYEDRVRFGNSMRYHISNSLRDRLTPEQVAELGMKTANALRRSQLNRDERRAELTAAREAGFDKRTRIINRVPQVTDKDALRARLEAMLAALDD